MSQRSVREARQERFHSAGVITIPPEGRSIRSVEAELLGITLRLTSWNKSAAARILGISRPTLHKKLDEYGIVAPSAESPS